MSHIIHLHKDNGFSIVELLTAALVAVYVIFGSWSVYVIGWTWWHEISPTIEAQRAARHAILSVVEGNVDSTTGTDVIGASTYKRRRGIQNALFDAANPTPTTPLISADGRRIDFRLEQDGSNARSFYFSEAEKVVYYVDSDSVSHRLESTQGLTDLRFGFYMDALGVVHYDMVQVTATVSKDVLGTRQPVPYHIEILCQDHVYLKNKLL